MTSDYVVGSNNVPDEVFRQRSEILTLTKGSLDKDEYDNQFTVYIMVRHNGVLQASCRLLNTGSHYTMLQGTFQSMFPLVRVRSPSIWECSRVVSTGASGVLECLINACKEWGRVNEASAFLGLYEAKAGRVYRAHGMKLLDIADYTSKKTGVLKLALWPME